MGTKNALFEYYCAVILYVISIYDVSTLEKFQKVETKNVLSRYF